VTSLETSSVGRDRPGRPRRDHATLVTYVQLAFWAWFLYAFGATQALLRDEQGTSRAVASLHGTAMALGGLVGALLAARVIARWGRGAVLRASGLAVAGLVVLYTAPGAPFAVTILGIALVSLAGTMLMISINAFILDHQGSGGPAALTEANALASLAGLLAPLAVGLGAAGVLGWRAGVWVMVIGLVGVELWRGRRLTVYGTRGLARQEATGGPFGAPVYWSLAILMCFLAAEFCMTYWGADLLRERCGFGPAAAAASLAAITGGMLVGRVGGARLAEHVPAERLLGGSIALSLAGFALAWAFAWWPVVLTGLFATGIGLSVQWPLGVARIVRASGHLTDRASAAASVAGNIAMALAPFALGLLSDTVGFHQAFLLVPGFLVVAWVVLWRRPVH
jgi:predicted MFS family arabinose efflux permease